MHKNNALLLSKFDSYSYIYGYKMLNMINRILVLGILIWISYGIHGQITLQGGFNASSLRVSDGIFAQETSSRLGFHVGAHYSTPLGPNFNFKPGIIYSQKGAGFGSFVPTLDLNYLDFPILFVYQKYPDQSFFAEGGPYFSYLLSAKDGSFDLKDDYKSNDIGIALGAGYDLGRIVLGGRGLIGFRNIPSQNPGTTQDFRTTNITGQLYLGLQL